jgi:hypothetical protein
MSFHPFCPVSPLLSARAFPLPLVSTNPFLPSLPPEDSHLLSPPPHPV